MAASCRPTKKVATSLQPRKQQPSQHGTRFETRTGKAPHARIARPAPFGCCARAQQACRKGYRALYRRAPRFFDELTLARADGTYPRLLARLARAPRVRNLIAQDLG